MLWGQKKICQPGSLHYFILTAGFRQLIQLQVCCETSPVELNLVRLYSRKLGTAVICGFVFPKNGFLFQKTDLFSEKRIFFLQSCVSFISSGHVTTHRKPEAVECGMVLHSMVWYGMGSRTVGPKTLGPKTLGTKDRRYKDRWSNQTLGTIDKKSSALWNQTKGPKDKKSDKIFKIFFFFTKKDFRSDKKFKIFFFFTKNDFLCSWKIKIFLHAFIFRNQHGNKNHISPMLGKT